MSTIDLPPSPARLDLYHFPRWNAIDFRRLKEALDQKLEPDWLNWVCCGLGFQATDDSILAILIFVAEVILGAVGPKSTPHRVEKAALNGDDHI